MADDDDEIEAFLADALNRIAAGEDVNTTDEDGTTALHVAASAGQFEVVELLLEAKACVHMEDADGACALVLACQEGHASCVKVLLAGGADPLAECNGASALAEASLSGSSQCVELLEAAARKQLALLEAQAELDAARAVDGMEEVGVAYEEEQQEEEQEEEEQQEEEQEEEEGEEEEEEGEQQHEKELQPTQPAVQPTLPQQQQAIASNSVAAAVLHSSSSPQHQRSSRDREADEALRAIQARMHAVRIVALRRMQRIKPTCVTVSAASPDVACCHWGPPPSSSSSATSAFLPSPSRSLRLRGRASDIEALRDGWVAVLRADGRLYAADTHAPVHGLGHAVTRMRDDGGDEDELSEYNPCGDGDDEGEDEGEEDAATAEGIWLLGAPCGSRLLCVRAAVGMVHIHRLDRIAGRLRLQCMLPPVEGASGGYRARIEDAAWLADSSRALVCAEAWCRLFDAASGDVLLSLSQDAVLGAGIGRRIKSVGVTADGSVCVIGSTHGRLIAWGLSGATRGQPLHHQPHSTQSYGPISRVQPIGPFGGHRRAAHAAASSAGGGRLVSLQTSDSAGTCVESVRVWRQVDELEAERDEQLGQGGKGAAWHCIIQFRPNEIAEVIAPLRLVLCAETDARVGVWSVEDGSLRAIIDPQTPDESAQQASGQPLEWCLQVSRDGSVCALDLPGDAIALYETTRFERIWTSEPGVDMVALG